MPSRNMLTPDDKKFILMAIHDGMVELAGTTADLIDGVSTQLKITQDDVSILKRQAIYTNKCLTLIRDDLSLIHRRVEFLEQARVDMVNDAEYDPDSGTN